MKSRRLSAPRASSNIAATEVEQLMSCGAICLATPPCSYSFLQNSTTRHANSNVLTRMSWPGSNVSFEASIYNGGARPVPDAKRGRTAAKDRPDDIRPAGTATVAGDQHC